MFGRCQPRRTGGDVYDLTIAEVAILKKMEKGKTLMIGISVRSSGNYAILDKSPVKYDTAMHLAKLGLITSIKDKGTFFQGYYQISQKGSNEIKAISSRIEPVKEVV